ncbi:MAG: hypothetical protein K0Q60_4376, partial [Microvirga sp.]|nr:hypothetical protein [Microvirga sp.]
GESRGSHARHLRRRRTERPSPRSPHRRRRGGPLASLSDHRKLPCRAPDRLGPGDGRAGWPSDAPSREPALRAADRSRRARLCGRGQLPPARGGGRPQRTEPADHLQQGLYRARRAGRADRHPTGLEPARLRRGDGGRDRPGCDPRVTRRGQDLRRWSHHPERHHRPRPAMGRARQKSHRRLVRLEEPRPLVAARTGHREHPGRSGPAPAQAPDDPQRQDHAGRRYQPDGLRHLHLDRVHHRARNPARRRRGGDRHSLRRRWVPRDIPQARSFGLPIPAEQAPGAPNGAQRDLV